MKRTVHSGVAVFRAVGGRQSPLIHSVGEGNIFVTREETDGRLPKKQCWESRKTGVVGKEVVMLPAGVS